MCIPSFPSTSQLHEIVLSVCPQEATYTGEVFKFSISTAPEYNNVPLILKLVLRPYYEKKSLSQFWASSIWRATMHIPLHQRVYLLQNQNQQIQ
ncbi:hypothetical protein NECAME_00604 [Necator americanus]|uniref:UBC core domain-containing protein n=1 Tax=Necator americanus TaxID=51031 RepID=W2SZW1_NECAM|nr:hypothetical protein NECAME_00604 [Necator americanus]ETN75193.1 hypothetical protein NECAME_00604 [Necator americanus]